MKFYDPNAVNYSGQTYCSSDMAIEFGIKPITGRG